MVKHKSRGQGLVGQHPLTAEQQLVGKIAAQPVQDAGRHRQNGRATQRAAELCGEDGIPHRFRRGGVDGAGQFRRCDRVRNQPHQIVALNPRHPLPAAADAAADAELEWREHARKQPALGAEHQADAQANRANAEPFGPLCGALDQVAGAMRERTLAAVELRQLFVRHSPYQPTADAVMSTDGRCSSRPISRNIARAIRSREATMRKRFARVHKPLANGSPARLTMASICVSLRLIEVGHQ